MAREIQGRQRGMTLNQVFSASYTIRLGNTALICLGCATTHSGGMPMSSVERVGMAPLCALIDYLLVSISRMFGAISSLNPPMFYRG